MARRKKQPAELDQMPEIKGSFGFFIGDKYFRTGYISSAGMELLETLSDIECRVLVFLVTMMDSGNRLKILNRRIANRIGLKQNYVSAAIRGLRNKDVIKRFYSNFIVNPMVCCACEEEGFGYVNKLYQEFIQDDNFTAEKMVIDAMTKTA